MSDDTRDTKTCTACGLTKSVVEFNKVAKGKPGYRSECRECQRLRKARWAASAAGKAWVEAYKSDPVIKERDRAYRATPDERLRSQVRKARWFSNPDNRLKANERSCTYSASERGREVRSANRKRKYKEEPNYACSVLIRAMLSRMARATGGLKSGQTWDVLGYTPDQFRQRIECQFQPGMSWDNRSLHTWHIDHKKPIAAFLRQGITDPRTINMLCNLQPMWAVENMEKGDRWPVAANDNARINDVAA